jgi:cellulose 1,4-beta-cellobiosidase
MPFTVVTQFIEAETFPGMLSAIRRFYVQNNTVIPNSESLIDGNPGNELTSEFCTAQKQAFGDDDFFNSKGGFENLSRAVAGTMVLVMGVWDDHYAHMLWLDSLYPPYDEGMGPGMERGSCGIDSGDPEYLVNNQGPDQVVFSNIKFGPVGSTF